MVTNQTLIEFACLQYCNNEDFKLFADAWFSKLSGLLAFADSVQACFATPVDKGGTPLAKYLLEKFEGLSERRPHSSS